jgi:ParE toxin of type II toxin-antitoxin system, parDE
MARVVKRPAAKRDLVQQWVWYAEKASIAVADRFLVAVDSTLEALASQPDSGETESISFAWSTGAAIWNDFSSKDSLTESALNCKGRALAQL